MNGLDFSELTNFKKELMEDVAQDFPQDVQKFLDKEKRKLLKVVKKTAKANVGKKTGNYYKSLKAGKTHYNKKSKDLYTKVYALTTLSICRYKNHYSLYSDCAKCKLSVLFFRIIP